MVSRFRSYALEGQDVVEELRSISNHYRRQRALANRKSGSKDPNVGENVMKIDEQSGVRQTSPLPRQPPNR